MEIQDLLNKVSSKEFDPKAFADKLTGTISDITKPLATLQDELRKVQVPLRRKDVSVNGKNVIKELLEDGRVVMHFGTMEEAEAFYDSNTKWSIKNIFSK